MSDIKWTVGTSAAKVEPVEYIPLTRNNSKSTDEEKERNRQWNAMVNALRDAGMMREKGEEEA